MATQSNDGEELFKQKLAETLIFLKDEASKDEETILLTGSIAVQVMNKGKVPNWKTLKAALSREAYNELLMMLRDQGNEFAQSGNERAASAMQVLGCSVVGGRSADPRIASGVKLLDLFIDSAIKKLLNKMAAPTPSSVASILN